MCVKEDEVDLRFARPRSSLAAPSLCQPSIQQPVFKRFHLQHSEPAFIRGAAIPRPFQSAVLLLVLPRIEHCYSSHRPPRPVNHLAAPESTLCQYGAIGPSFPLLCFSLCIGIGNGVGIGTSYKGGESGWLAGFVSRSE